MSDFAWITSKIKHTPYNSNVILYLVVYGIRKSFGQHTVVAINDLVNTSIENQRINVRKRESKK